MKPPSTTLLDNRSNAKADVSFLIPMYNEEKTIRQVMDVLSGLPVTKEIIVVDDGSKDKSVDIALSAAPRETLLIRHYQNQGKGGAIQTALNSARGRYIAIQDADLEYDPREYVNLLEKAAGGNYPVVFGSRFLKTNPTLYKRFYWGNKLMTWSINLLFASCYSDTYSCYKLIRKDVFLSLDIQSFGFEMEAEICSKIAKRKIPFAEVPISYRPRTIEDGKKINAQDALKGLWTAWRWRF